MKIAVSACLIGENCKYNGGNNLNQSVRDFLASHEVVSICPEVLGGLPTPRIPAEIVNGEVKNAQGISVDAQFREGAQRALEILEKEGVAYAILQPRSPSCGVRQVYDGSFSGVLVNEKGVFAELLVQHGIKTYEPDELVGACFSNEIDTAYSAAQHLQD